MYLELINLLQVVYVFLALFGILLVRHSKRFHALRLLLRLQALLMIFNLLEELGVTRNDYLITPAFTLGFGPAIYFFVRQLVYGQLPRKAAVHFVPLVLSLAATHHWPQWVIALGSVSQALYLAAAVALVKRYHQVSRQVRSDAQDLQLHWLNLILGIFLLMMLQDLVRLNLQPYAPMGLLHWWYLINTAIEFSLSAYLILKAVRQPEIFEGFAEFHKLGIPAAAHSNLSAEALPVFAQIDQLVQREALFKQPRLSLRDLAQSSGLNEKTLSWAINQGAGKSFCDYINGLRIKAVCDHLRQASPPENLLQLAFAMGFSAKSTFNTVFKKETGLTPSQYARLAATSNPLSANARSES